MEDPPWAQQERYATLAARLENADALEERLGAWTRDQDAETLAATLQHAGVEAGAVRDFGGLHADPQLAAREHFVRLEHPVLGPLAYERSGARLSRTPGRLDRPAPRLGEHTRSILSGILGLSAEEIEALAAAEVNL
jgi:benzylsuccinate CoA-transferase BbsF subunit/naphthyl-2-methylsuccinate CoA transferase subunit